MVAAVLLPGCENENNVTGGKANVSVPSQVVLDDIAGDGDIRTFDVESDGYWSVIATGPMAIRLPGSRSSPRKVSATGA